MEKLLQTRSVGRLWGRTQLRVLFALANQCEDTRIIERRNQVNRNALVAFKGTGSPDGAGDLPQILWDPVGDIDATKPTQQKATAPDVRPVFDTNREHLIQNQPVVTGLPQSIYSLEERFG